MVVLAMDKEPYQAMLRIQYSILQRRFQWAIHIEVFTDELRGDHKVFV